MPVDETIPVHQADITLPGALVEAVQRRVDKGLYASLDEFLAEAVRERLRVIGGSYHTVYLDSLFRKEEEGEAADAGDAPEDSQD